MSKQNERFTEALDRIDARYVSEAMAYYGEKPIAMPSYRKRMNLFAIAAAVAACLALLMLAIPITNTVITEFSAVLPGVFGGSEADENVVDYDGSRGLLYRVNADGETASFVGFGTCTDEDIVIASHYNGLPVVEMRNQPYYDEDRHYNDFAYGNEYAKSITISDTVKRVLGAIIDECPNLERVYIGASVEGFQKPMMNYPSKVVSIEVSPENKYYSDEGNCLVDLRAGRLVWGCNTSVIPDNGSIEIIGASAFYNAVEFTATYLPEGIKTIEPGAFSFCLGLKNLRLPSTLEKNFGSTFSNCANLECVDLNGYSVIEPGMFTACTSLKEVKGSESVTYIAAGAFSGCTSLTLDLGTSLEKINERSFAFLYQNGEAVINFAGTVAEWNAIEKAEDWNTNSDLVTVNCTDGVIRLTGK